MIRFAVSPEGFVVPDLEGTLPGRGLWVTADRNTLIKAFKKSAFGKAARRSVRVDRNLPDLVETLLKRRCLETIGLARRAGIAVAGFEKVREALKHGKAGVLLAASDGAEDGRAKVRGLAGDAPVIDLFDSGDLGHAFGRDHAVHAMLARAGWPSAFWRSASGMRAFARVSRVMEIAVRHRPAGQQI